MQDALDGLTKENVRLRADTDYLQSQLDLAVQQADQAQASKRLQSPKTVVHVSYLACQSQVQGHPITHDMLVVGS